MDDGFENKFRVDGRGRCQSLELEALYPISELYANLSAANGRRGGASPIARRHGIMMTGDVNEEPVVFIHPFAIVLSDDLF